MSKNPYVGDVPEPESHGDYFAAWDSLAGDEGIYPYGWGQKKLLKKFGERDLHLRAVAFAATVGEWFKRDLYALMRFGLSCGDYIHHDKSGNPVADCPDCQDGRIHRLDHTWSFKMIKETGRRDDNGELHRQLRYFFRAGLKTTTLNALLLQHIARNGDLRVMYYSRTVELAIKRSGFAKKELETNPLLWLVWPHICWGADTLEDAPQWTPAEWTVRRETRKGKAGTEATVTCSGIMAGLKTGGHPDLIIFDDIEDDANAHSNTQAAKTVRNVMAADKIGEAHRLVWYVGTIYNNSGPLKQLVKEGFIKTVWNESAVDFRHEVERYGKPSKSDPDRLDIGGFQPVYHTAVELAEWRGKSQTAWREFCLQYLCRVDMVSVAELDSERLGWTKSNPYELAAKSNIYILGDPGGFPEFSRSQKLSDSVILVVALGPDRRMRLIDGVASPMGSTKRCQELFRLVKKWSTHGNLIEVRWEEGGTGGDTSHIQYMQTTTENYIFRVVRVTRGGGAGQMNKIQRIYDFVEPLLDRLILRKRIPVVHRDDPKNLSDLVVQALDDFPAKLELGDILDALAMMSEPVGKEVKVIRGDRILSEEIRPLKWPNAGQRFLEDQHGPTVHESLAGRESQGIAAMLGVSGVPMSEFRPRGAA